MRIIGASVLVFEALVVLLAIPVAVTLYDVDPWVAGVGGGLLALGCLVTAGLLGRPGGFAVGWGLQVLVVASGLVVPAMYFLGGLFAVLWGLGLRVGRKGEDARARLVQEGGPPPGPDPDPRG